MTLPAPGKVVWAKLYMHPRAQLPSTVAAQRMNPSKYYPHIHRWNGQHSIQCGQYIVNLDKGMVVLVVANEVALLVWKATCFCLINGHVEMYGSIAMYSHSTDWATLK